MAIRNLELAFDVTVHVTSENPHHVGRWICHCPALAMQDVDLGALDDMDIDAAAMGAMLRAHHRAAAVCEALSNRIWQTEMEISE